MSSPTVSGSILKGYLGRRRASQDSGASVPSRQDSGQPQASGFEGRGGGGVRGREGGGGNGQTLAATAAMTAAPAAATATIPEETNTEWTEHFDSESGNYYYQNSKTDETSWERPPAMGGAEHFEHDNGGDGGEFMVHNTSFRQKLKQRMQGSTRKIEGGIGGVGENEGEGANDDGVTPREQKEDEDKNVLSNRMIAYKSSGTDRGRGGRRGGGKGGGRGGGRGRGRGGHGLAGRRSDTLSVEL